MKLFYFVLLVPIFLCNGMDQSFDDDLHQEMDKVRTSIIAAIETCNRKIDQCKLGISELKDDMRTLKVQRSNLEKIKGVLDFIEVPDALDHYFNSPSKEKRDVAKLNFISYVTESSSPQRIKREKRRRSVSARTVATILQFGDESYDEAKNPQIVPITPRRMKTIEENSALSDSSEKIKKIIRDQVDFGLPFDLGGSSSSEEKAIDKRKKFLRSQSHSSMDNLIPKDIKKIRKKNSFSFGGNRNSIKIKDESTEDKSLKDKKNKFFGSKSHSSSNKKEKTKKKIKKKK